MGEIIRTWLRTRLGVIIDLNPRVFGHYARDGTLLAKLLHSYDIINESQLRTLGRTHDPALSRVNLRNLRIWLRFIGVEFDDECIDDISNGKGTTALRLFYKVFLVLENKDSLHFITLQKEREKFVPNSSKFDVTTVPEEPDEHRESDDHPLAAPLRRATSLIDWQRKKAFDVKKREKLRISLERHEVRRPSPERRPSAPRSTRPVLGETDMRDLDEFASKHRVDDSAEPLKSCEDIPNFRGERARSHRADQEAAKAYTKSLRQKYRQRTITKGFEKRMQKDLMAEVWDKVVRDEELEFDELLARKVLGQSQYEKRMIRKLCDIRNETVRMAGNRQIVEELAQRTREREARLDHERAREILVRESEELEAERRRMNELERRINEDAARRRLRKIRKIGEEAVNDLVAISTRAAEYKIASDGEEVPRSLWNEWIARFVRSRPIVAAADDDYVKESQNQRKMSRVEAANVPNDDDDFENYHSLRSPWSEFVAGVDDETQEFLSLGMIVLGRAVHKILRSLRAGSEEPADAPLPPMKIRATLLGVPDTLLYEPIRELLRRSRIHLVCLEDAINHCLERYKDEMKDHEYIDLNIVAMTRVATRQSSVSNGERRKNSPRKDARSASSGAKSAASAKRLNQPRNGVDKVTQTPRLIPHEDLDPTLSDAAYIGKWTHEFLTLGQPLSDDLNARIILQYLRSLRDARGFVLVNYPTTYRQMTTLELALSGRKIPDRRENADDGNIEEIEPVPSRITFEEEGHDSSEQLTKSRLVPDPLERLANVDGRSYFTAYVRVAPRSRDVVASGAEEYEILPDDRTSLEAFYADGDIASVFYYASLDLATLKRLARLLVAGETTLKNLSSEELFGEYFAARSDDDDDSFAAPTVKKLLSRASVASIVESGASEWTEGSYEAASEVATSRISKDEPARPGEAAWRWAGFPQSLQLVQSLANLWQALETSYVESLKDTLRLKRTSLEAIIPYTNFVKKHAREFVERPDKKQDLLHEFHRGFNDVDEDIRDDAEAKRELHCRVADFETMLFDMCNERRKEAEEERRRIIGDHWTTREAIVLANVYIGIVQAELDRFVDTIQFVQDYYMEQLQRPLQEVRQSRHSLQRIPLDTTVTKEIVASEKMSSKSIGEKKSRESQAKTSSAKFSPPTFYADENVFEEEIAELLTNVQQANFDPRRTICYKSVEANVHYVQATVDTMASSALDTLKKEETAASKSPAETREKKGSRKDSQASAGDRESARKRVHDFFLEWRYAMKFEISRIQQRLRMLEVAARSDVNFLIEGMRRLFFGFHKLLVDRFNNEMRSVSSMASTFRFAIEEARPIQEEMLLDGDRFLIRSSVLMFPDKSQPNLPASREEASPSNFQMAQLGRLFDVFRRVAPRGTLAERSFVYVLQDLIACGDEEGGITPLPSSWLQLRACDVPRLVADIFGDVDFVDWREFIIYAMDVPTPSVDQLLDALEAFGQADKNSTDTVTCKAFRCVPLWFLNGNDADFGYSRSLLHENFDDDAEDEEDVEVEAALIDWTPGGRRESGDKFGNDENVNPEAILRMKLARDLLGEMFLTRHRRVNYMAVLLAFCKDYEPREGLAKALSIAVGGKICADWNEGERYVEELMEKRRGAKESNDNRGRLREEATLTSKAILNVVLRKVERKSRDDDDDEMAEVLSTTKYDTDETKRLPIRIEKLDEPGESVDPADLLPPSNESPISPVDDADRAVTPEEIVNHVATVIATRPGSEETTEKCSQPANLVYWLDLEVCQAVLAAMLPRLATQPDVFETGRSLRENLHLVSLELRDETLNDEARQILAHRFLNHSFVRKVAADGSQYTCKHLGSLVKKILRENE